MAVLLGAKRNAAHIRLARAPLEPEPAPPGLVNTSPTTKLSPKDRILTSGPDIPHGERMKSAGTRGAIMLATRHVPQNPIL